MFKGTGIVGSVFLANISGRSLSEIPGLSVLEVAFELVYLHYCSWTFQELNF